MQSPDSITFLVASDTHLGYKEKDPIRGKDSFKTFNEVLQIANAKKVDFVLLGGDLFHQNRPSRKTMHDCMEILTENCLGERPCGVQIVSDQVENFGHTSKTVKSVNYENPNINVSMPVLSIHGNHDDPAAADSLSAIDLLSVPGLLNHFGKATGTESIRVKPVILQKGSTTIALYGLGAIHDERLYGLFVRNKVEFVRSEIASAYNIMVIHQNRYERGQRKYIPEDFLDEFFDLVIWGHEHECITSLSKNTKKGFSVLQPGSSVATKLIEAESKKKHAFVFKICRHDMGVTPIELKTTRILQFETIHLEGSGIDSSDEYGIDNKIIACCEEKVQEMIAKAKQEQQRHNGQPELPLIRLRVDYGGGYPTFDRQRFGRRFKKQIANPDDSVIRFILSRQAETRTHGGVKEAVFTAKVEDLILEYLKDKKMIFLSPHGMGEAVKKYGEHLEGGPKSKKTADAISIFCEENLNRVCLHLKQLPSLAKEEDAIAKQIVSFAKNADEIVMQSNDVTSGATSSGLCDQSTRRDSAGHGRKGIHSECGPTSSRELAPNREDRKRTTVKTSKVKREMAAQGGQGTSALTSTIQSDLNEREQHGKKRSASNATSSNQLPSSHDNRKVREHSIQKTLKGPSNPFSRFFIPKKNVKAKNIAKQKKLNAGQSGTDSYNPPLQQAGHSTSASPRSSTVTNSPTVLIHDDDVITIDSDDSMNNDDVEITPSSPKHPRFEK